MHLSRWNSKLLSKIYTSIYSLRWAVVASFAFVSVQIPNLVNAVEETGRVSGSKAAVSGPLSFGIPSFPLLRYSVVDCRDSLQTGNSQLIQSKNMEKQLVGLALSEGKETRYESLFRLLSHYGVVSSWRFTYSSFQSLLNLGMGGHLANSALESNDELEPANFPLIQSKKYLEVKFQLFRKLRDIAIAIQPKSDVEGQIIQARDQKELAKRIQSQMYTPFDLDVDTYLGIAKKIWADLLEHSREHSSSEEHRRTIRLLEAMGPDNFAWAIRPMAARIFANAADRMAASIQASLVAQTVKSYRFWTTAPLKITGIVALSYFVGSPIYEWISVGQIRELSVLSGIMQGAFPSVFVVGTAALASMTPNLKMKWMYQRAEEVVAEKLWGPGYAMDFEVGKSTFSLNQFFQRSNGLHPELNLSLDEVCTAEDICKLGPAQIAGLGDIQVQKLIDEVNSYLDPNPIVEENNQRIEDLSSMREAIAEVLGLLDGSIQIDGGPASPEGLLNYKLLNYKWMLEQLSEQKPVYKWGYSYKNPELPDYSGMVQKHALAELQTQIATMVEQIEILMEAIVRAEPKSSDEIELLGFLSNKLSEHRRVLKQAAATAIRLEKSGGWAQWSVKIGTAAKRELKILNDQIIPLILGKADVKALSNATQSPELRNLRAHPKNRDLQLQVAKQYFLNTDKFQKQFRIRE